MSISGNSERHGGDDLCPGGHAHAQRERAIPGLADRPPIEPDRKCRRASTADGFMDNTGATGGAILAGDFYVYVDNSNGLLVSDELIASETQSGP